MTKVSDILALLEKVAPSHLAESYDNVGHIVGRGNSSVTKVLVALDITGSVIEEAKSWGAELIVSHHPVIFGERKRITDADITGELVLRLCESRINAICMHTNLDSASGGVNDILAKKLGITVEGIVDPFEDGISGGGRYGEISEEKSLGDFLKTVCSALSTKGARFHDAKIPVRRVAVGGGSCGDYVTSAKRLGCDTLVTADVKHNQMLDAAHIGINVIDAGHFATEDVVCPYLENLISDNFGDLEIRIAEADSDCTQYYTL